MQSNRNRHYKFLIAGLLFLTLDAEANAAEINDLISREDTGKIEAITSTRSVGKIEMGGMTGEVEILFAAPDKIRMSSDFGFLKMSQAYDGNTAWLNDQNNQIMELTGGEKRSLVNAAYLTGMSYCLPDRMRADIEYQRDTTIGDSDYSIFTASPADGDTLLLYFSNKHHRLEIVGERLDEIMIYTYMSDFRVIDGLEMPFTYESRASAPEFNSTIRLSSIEANVPIDHSIFSMNDKLETDLYYPDEADSVVIPIYYYNDHIFIEVSVNGNKEVYFILDSGAGANVLDSSYAVRLGLERFGGVPAKGIAGYESVAFAKIDSLSIGRLKLGGGLAAIINLKSLSLRLPGELGGLIGYDLLSKLPFKIIYKTKEIMFYRPDRFSPPDSIYAVDFELMLKAPLISAVYGDFSGKFLIDLGNPFGLMLHRAFVEKHNLKETFSDIKEMGGKIGGIGGKSEAYAATGANLLIGAVDIEHPPVMVVEAGRGFSESSTVDGNIGNQLLRNFSILMDYSKKKLYILPPEK